VQSVAIFGAFNVFLLYFLILLWTQVPFEKLGGYQQGIQRSGIRSPSPYSSFQTQPRDSTISLASIWQHSKIETSNQAAAYSCNNQNAHNPKAVSTVNSNPKGASKVFARSVALSFLKPMKMSPPTISMTIS
jgi:hypothetical protein